MTATNHAMTGALIGLVIASPMALPIAFLSHFVLDAIPHFGVSGVAGEKLQKLRSNWFRNYLIVEALICFLLVLSIFVLQPAQWLLACVCAFLAASPDLFSYNRYSKVRHGKVWTPNTYSRFASRIQWFERPIGAVVEVAWLLAVLYLLAKII